MKYSNDNVHNQVIDSKTGISSFVLNPAAKSIEYSDEELRIWIKNNAVPSDLGNFHLKELKRQKIEFDNLKKFNDENPNATDEQRLEHWSKNTKIPTKEELDKKCALTSFLLDNHERLQYVLEASKNPKTFSIPSHSIMFSLLAMFAGKPDQIPRKLLEKSHSERTKEENEEAEKYLNNIFETEKFHDFSEGKETIQEKRIALICDNSKVEGRAEISMSLFRHDLSFREERLAIYIKKAFGAEGIRHLLGLIIGLEENFRQGHFEWSVNEHLDRLGYRRKTNGSFDQEVKRTASEIIKIFTGLCITSIRKDNKNESIKAKFLFMVEGFEIQAFEKEIIDEKITLVATDFWYKNAFSPRDGQVPQYTKLLKEIVKENHREHPLTLYLAPLFSIFWRMNPERKLKVKNLMDWCGLNEKDSNRSYHLKDLESTLEYMKAKKYLGDWTNNGEKKFPSQCKDSYECVLTFTPPDWLKQEFLSIENKREMPALPEKQKPFTKLEFLELFNKSGLTRKQFGNSIGVTPQLVTAIMNGKRTITPKTSEKLRIFISERQEVN